MDRFGLFDYEGKEMSKRIVVFYDERREGKRCLF
jgi:hypothetical protein